MTIVARKVSAASPSYFSIPPEGEGNKRWVFDFRNPDEAVALLDSLGAVYSVSANGRYFDAAQGKYIAATVNRPRLSYNLTFQEYALLGEAAQTNLIPYSSEDDASYTHTNITIEGATSLMDGKTAPKMTAVNNTDNYTKLVGTFSGSDETIYALVETTATTFDIALTGAATLAWLRYDPATQLVTELTDQNGSTIQNSWGRNTGYLGPNGGYIHILAMHFDSTAQSGGNRRLRFYPSSTGGAPGYSILHHWQLTETEFVSSPIVCDASAVTRAADNIYVPFDQTVADGVKDITLAVDFFREYSFDPSNTLSHGGCYVTSGSFVNSILLGGNNTSLSATTLISANVESTSYARAKPIAARETVAASISANRMLAAAINEDTSLPTYSGATPPANSTPTPYYLYFAGIEGGGQNTNNEVFCTYLEYGARALSDLVRVVGAP